MKKPNSCLLKCSIKFLLLVSFCIPFQNATAQFTNTPEGRLALLCKTWGMLKYHHPEVKVMNVNWDSVLIAHVLNVKNAPTLIDFNTELNNLIDAAGPVPITLNPSVPNMPLNIDFNWINDSMLDATVQAKLNFIKNNFVADFNYWVSYNGPQLTFPYDNNPSPNDTFPALEFRYLNMFKFWNIINYYAPYKSLMDVSWDQTLVDLIPAFDTASSALEYQLSFCLLCKRINDTHSAYVYSPQLWNQWKFNQNYPPVFLRHLNNQTIVYKLFQPVSGLHPGDVIHKINGMDADSLRMEYRKYFSSSTENVGNTLALMDLQQTYGNPSIQYEVEDSTGAINSVTANATMSLSAYNDTLYSGSWHGPAYQITNCGYGYVNMGLLQASQVNAMYNALKSAPAIIFDLRNYPNFIVHSITNYFFTANVPTVRLHNAVPEFPGDFITNFISDGYNNPNGYTGKIYILVNEITQSRAEFTAMILSAMPGPSSVKTIGSQTSGGDGDLASLFLPGNLRVAFSGTGIYYPDSTPTQRIGVKIDSVVVPSRAGLYAGIDEVLYAAFDCLTGINENHTGNLNFNVYPNPSYGIFNAVMNSNCEEATLTVLDITGKEVYHKRISNALAGEHINLDLKNLNNGIYMIQLKSNQNVFSKKIIKQ